MQHIFDGFNDLIRLEKGEQLSESIEKFLASNQIPGAWINGIGAASDVTVGFYNLSSREFKWRTFGGTSEVVSLSGNIAFDQNGMLAWHLHGVFANDEFQTFGGHVKDLTTAATLELFVHRTYKPIHRKLDEAVGLQLLDLE